MRFLILFILQFLLLATAHSQKIEILSAGALKLDTTGGQMARKLVGNVKLRQDSVTLECDSALFYTNINAVDAYGNVHIHDEQARAYADSLKYDGDKKIATLSGNVRVLQDSAQLETNKLFYNSQTKSGSYFNGGKVTSKDMTVISRRGYYYTQSGDAHFSDNVVVTGTDYEMKTDTLRYNTNSKISYFYGPTDIIRPKENIYCESGWYNANTGISVFGENTVLITGSQTLLADSLYYDSKAGYGEAYKQFEWIDTSSDAILSGKKGVFYREQNRVTATDSAMLTYLMDKDSLFLTADTLKSKDDTLTDATEFFAFPKVRIFKSNLQGVCDSLAFSFNDSTIKMFRDPILWNESNQLTGDTVTILLKNDQIDMVELFQNGFIVNQAHVELFNQIKGRHIFGYFVERELHHMLVDGNGESVYYGKDDDGSFIGMNKAVCSKMWIYLKDEQVNKITFLSEPDATFHPIQLINPADHLLKGFEWKEHLRPLSREDLLKAED